LLARGIGSPIQRAREGEGDAAPAHEKRAVSQNLRAIVANYVLTRGAPNREHINRKAKAEESAAETSEPDRDPVAKTDDRDATPWADPLENPSGHPSENPSENPSEIPLENLSYTVHQSASRESAQGLSVSATKPRKNATLSQERVQPDQFPAHIGDRLVVSEDGAILEQVTGSGVGPLQVMQKVGDKLILLPCRKAAAVKRQLLRREKASVEVVTKARRAKELKKGLLAGAAAQGQAAGGAPQAKGGKNEALLGGGEDVSAEQLREVLDMSGQEGAQSEGLSWLGGEGSTATGSGPDAEYQTGAPEASADLQGFQRGLGQGFDSGAAWSAEQQYTQQGGPQHYSGGQAGGAPDFDFDLTGYYDFDLLAMSMDVESGQRQGAGRRHKPGGEPQSGAMLIALTQEKAGSADANFYSVEPSEDLLLSSLADSEAVRGARRARAERAFLRNVCALANAPQERKTEALWKVHGLRMRGLITAETEPVLTKTVSESVALLEAVEKAAAPVFVRSQESGRSVLEEDVTGRARKRMPDKWMESVLAQTGWTGEKWWQQGTEHAGARLLRVPDFRGSVPDFRGSVPANCIQYESDCLRGWFSKQSLCSVVAKSLQLFPET
jgi:hypothetical protein